MSNKSKIKNRSDKAKTEIISREDPGVSFKDEPPKFSLRYIQSSHCITKCTHDEQIDFVQAMFRRKDRAWKHLETDPHGGLGCEPIRHGVKVTIPPCAEGRAILSFRFSGKKAMVGFRERDVFYILWFDRDFSVYQH